MKLILSLLLISFKQHIGGDFFFDLVGTGKATIAEAFKDKLETEIFIEEK